MKTTLFIVGICNLAIACTTTHPNTIEINFDVTQASNYTETQTKRCDLSKFISLEVNTVSNKVFKQEKDVVGYVRALEAQNEKLTSDNISLLKELLECHSR